MELSRKIAVEITKYARENQANVIVFEYLEMQGKISGKKKQKLHYGESRIFRNCVNIRRTDVEYIFPEYLPATQAG